MQNLLTKNLKKKRKAWNDRLEEIERRETKKSGKKRRITSPSAVSHPSLESELTKMRGRLAEISRLQENVKEYSQRAWKKSYETFMKGS